MERVALAKELFDVADSFEKRTKTAGLDMFTLLLDQIRVEALVILEESDRLNMVDGGNTFLQTYKARGGRSAFVAPSDPTKPTR